MENIKITGYSAAIISTILLGSLGIFVRNISANVYIITFTRLGLGLLFLTLFLIIKKEIWNVTSTKFSFSLLASGVFITIAILFYTQAINKTTLANAAFLLYLGPLVAAGLAVFLLDEKFTYLSVAMLCLAFLGVLFLLEFNLSFNADETKGYLWGGGAAICYALYIIFNRKIPNEVPALTRSFYQFLFGTIIMLPFLDKSVLTLSTKDLYWLVAIGFFQGFLAITLLILAVKRLKAIEYGTISYFEPIVASLVGLIFYSENLSLLQMIGYSIVFSGGITQVITSKNG